MSSRKRKHNIRFAQLRKNLEQIRSKRYILQQKHSNHNNKNRT